MKGDFSRLTFDPLKGYTRVLMQQGRVQLDADWNEQVSILLHYLQNLAKDLIGPYGGPIDNPGFAITADEFENFGIGAGNYYVDGMLCRVEAAGVPITFLGANQVQVSSWVVDNLDFQKGQHVEVFNDVH